MPDGGSGATDPGCSARSCMAGPGPTPLTCPPGWRACAIKAGPRLGEEMQKYVCRKDGANVSSRAHKLHATPQALWSALNAFQAANPYERREEGKLLVGRVPCLPRGPSCAARGSLSAAKKAPNTAKISCPPNQSCHWTCRRANL